MPSDPGVPLAGLSFVSVSQFAGYILVHPDTLAAYIQDREHDAAARARGIGETQLLTVRQVAAYLAVSTQTVARLAAEGELRAVPIRKGLMRFHWEDVQTFLDRDVPAETQQVAPRRKRKLMTAEEFDEYMSDKGNGKGKRPAG